MFLIENAMKIVVEIVHKTEGKPLHYVHKNSTTGGKTVLYKWKLASSSTNLLSNTFFLPCHDKHFFNIHLSFIYVSDPLVPDKFVWKVLTINDSACDW